MVEMLIVLMLTAILAAISTKLVTSKGTAAIAVLKSDLRNIATAQEAYFSDHGTYATLSELDYNISSQVNVSIRATATGWAGRVEHQLRSEYRCALFLGTITPYTPATEEGLLACEPRVGGGGCSGP